MSFAESNKESQLFECPFCGVVALTIKELEHTVPYFNEVLLVWHCSNCGYRHVDIFPLKLGEPKRIILKISSPRDLYAKVIRSKNGVIRIPELGVIIEPGPASSGFITNVEGVIERVIENFKRMLVLYDYDEKDFEDVMHKLLLAKNGKLFFTLILEDPTGMSAIIPAHDKQEIITEKINVNDVKNNYIT